MNARGPPARGGGRFVPPPRGRGGFFPPGPGGGGRGPPLPPPRDLPPEPPFGRGPAHFDGRFYRGGRDGFGRGRFIAGRGDAGRFGGDGRGRFDDGGRGGAAAGRMMTSYSSLGRGIVGNGTGVPAGNRFEDNPNVASGRAGVGIGSYSALAGLGGGSGGGPAPPLKSYAELGGPSDDVGHVNHNPPPPARGSYSALADSIVDPPRHTYAMLANESSTQQPPSSSHAPPPSQTIGIKRGRDFHDGCCPLPKAMGYDNNPMSQSLPMSMRGGPPLPPRNAHEYDRPINNDWDRNPDGLPQPPLPRPPPNMDWERERNIIHGDVYNETANRMQEDQFGRQRPPMRGGFGRGFGHGGRGGGPPPLSLMGGRCGGAGGGPPPPRFRDGRSSLENNGEGFQPHVMEEERPLIRRESAHGGGGTGQRLEDTESFNSNNNNNNNNPVRQPPPVAKSKEALSNSTYSSIADRVHEQSNAPKSQTPPQPQQQSPPQSLELKCESTTPLHPNQEQQQQQQQQSTSDKSSDNTSPVDIIPTSPPRTPSPPPAPPSAFTVAMCRMFEMNADMEFAHVKLLMLELEHKRVMARLEALEEMAKGKGDD